MATKDSQAPADVDSVSRLAGSGFGSEASIARMASASDSKSIGNLAHCTDRAVITFVRNASASTSKINRLVVASAMPIPMALPCVSGVRPPTKIRQMNGLSCD